MPISSDDGGSHIGTIGQVRRLRGNFQDGDPEPRRVLALYWYPDHQVSIAFDWQVKEVFKRQALKGYVLRSGAQTGWR
jgi:hypothetical protein